MAVDILRSESKCIKEGYEHEDEMSRTVLARMVKTKSLLLFLMLSLGTKRNYKIFFCLLFKVPVPSVLGCFAPVFFFPDTATLTK